MSQPDLKAYFGRIGYAGNRVPGLETLRALHLNHAQSIPFENLTSLSHRPVRLDLPALENKLLREGRGGYCFEHNLLFSQVLRALGFEVTGLSARVLWNAPEGIIRPRNHMLLRVELPDGPWIADVGFGGLTLTGPLRLATDTAQPTPHEPFQLVTREGHYVLQSLVRGEWKPLYQFDLQTQFPVDYDVSNWWISTHPDSPFVNNLMAARPVPGRRYALFNRQLSIHELNGPTEQRTLTSASEIRAALEELFDIRVPGDDATESALSRL